MKEPIPVFEQTKAIHGEGPVWDPEAQKLYWVDISEGKFFKGDINSDTVETFNVGQPVGVLALINERRVIMGMRDGIGIFSEATKSVELIFRLPTGQDLRFNDGTVDPAGRFVAGTMNSKGDAPVGKLFSVDATHRVKILKENLFIPNGMKWSSDHKTFFLTDTPQHLIYAFDYEAETGNIFNQRNFIEFEKDEFPDGMCLDDEGGFWVALWGGSKLLRFDNRGKRIDEIKMPVPYATSCCFGGATRNLLFVTSSQRDLDANQKKQYPLSGSVFMIETNTTGPSQRRFAEG